jgi:cellulose 1,4-beta-cellobiosidase
LTRKKQVVQIVVYNLPNRDCSAEASAGELSVNDDGEAKYRDFIDRIVRELQRFPQIRVVLQLETDAIGNLVTNLGALRELLFEASSRINACFILANPKCAEAEDVQKRSMAYAIAKLQLPNVAIYLDGAHAGWLGWESNIGPAADVLTEIIAMAQAINPNAKVRGVATNVS